MEVRHILRTGGHASLAQMADLSTLTEEPGR